MQNLKDPEFKLLCPSKSEISCKLPSFSPTVRFEERAAIAHGCLLEVSPALTHLLYHPVCWGMPGRWRCSHQFPWARLP